MSGGTRPSLGNAQPFSDFKVMPHKGSLLRSRVAGSKHESPTQSTCTMRSEVAISGKRDGKSYQSHWRKKGSEVREKKDKKGSGSSEL